MDEYQSRRLDILLGQLTIGREETRERLDALRAARTGAAVQELTANSPRADSAGKGTTITAPE